MIVSMKSIIDRLKLSTFLYPNPELTRFQAGLRSVALDLDEMEDVRDDTLPDLGWIQENAGDELRVLNAVIFT
jgi:hypothetical protein